MASPARKRMHLYCKAGTSAAAVHNGRDSHHQQMLGAFVLPAAGRGKPGCSGPILPNQPSHGHNQQGTACLHRTFSFACWPPCMACPHETREFPLTANGFAFQDRSWLCMPTTRSTRPNGNRICTWPRISRPGKAGQRMLHLRFCLVLQSHAIVTAVQPRQSKFRDGSQHCKRSTSSRPPTHSPLGNCVGCTQPSLQFPQTVHPCHHTMMDMLVGF